jgi:hypothetical protein
MPGGNFKKIAQDTVAVWRMKRRYLQRKCSVEREKSHFEYLHIFEFSLIHLYHSLNQLAMGKNSGTKLSIDILNALWCTKERRAFRTLSGTVDADKL